MMQDEAMMEKTEDDAMMEKDMIQDEAMMKDEAMMEKTEDTMMAKGSYAAYSTDMLGKTENTVVFFHANWCPSCRAANSGISSGVVPENLTILKADYDSETELKKKYGVTTQHTFVLVDAQGEMIKKWVGGTSVEDIVGKL
jgi:thiol-disulfide isomerase/thioredoxin